MATGAMADLKQVLVKQFGIKSFRPGQKEVIERIMNGTSAAAVFPTGGGKSLCYQLPAVLLDGLSIVVSPLLALMREQVDQLKRLGVPAVRLDSTLSPDEAGEAMQQIRAGKVKLLYVAPERFFNEGFRNFISDIPIHLFAIDEAHCISQWGHSFRPDYLKLATAAQELKAKCVLALTATATPAVLDDIRKGFDIAPKDVVQTPFYRSNLAIRVTLTNAAHRDQLLLNKMKNHQGETVLVYVTLQKTAEEVAAYLEKNGVHARAYHAGMEDDERKEVQDWFMKSKDAIVVATIAFGMGIDKSAIRAIYHYNPSKSIESYAQEIGRAGRDGKPAVCETLLVPEDRVTLENFTYGDSPSPDCVEQFVERIMGQPQDFYISYYSLAYDTDIRDGVIRSLMTYLELQGYLRATSPRYDCYQFKPRKRSQDILANFEGERREFASSVLAMAVKKKVWFEINVAHATERLKCERSRLVKMLEYFAEKNWIELQVSGLVHGYKKLKPIQNIDAVTNEIRDYLTDREIGELTRLDQFFDLLKSQRCQHAVLSEHFGQPGLSDCGHCSVCSGEALGEFPEPDYPVVGSSAVTALKNLRKKHPDLLKDARRQAKLLCGLSSPKMIRARLTRDSIYGCCSQIPFDQVVDALVGS